MGASIPAGCGGWSSTRRSWAGAHPAVVFHAWDWQKFFRCSCPAGERVLSPPGWAVFTERPRRWFPPADGHAAAVSAVAAVMAVEGACWGCG